MGLRYRGFHDGSGKKHVAAQLAGALAPHTPHFLGPLPHLRNRTGAPRNDKGRSSSTQPRAAKLNGVLSATPLEGVTATAPEPGASFIVNEIVVKLLTPAESVADRRMV